MSFYTASNMESLSPHIKQLSPQTSCANDSPSSRGSTSSSSSSPSFKPESAPTLPRVSGVCSNTVTPLKPLVRSSPPSVIHPMKESSDEGARPDRPKGTSMKKVLVQRRKKLVKSALMVDKKIMRVHHLLMDEQKNYYEARIKSLKAKQEKQHSKAQRQEVVGQQEQQTQSQTHLNLIVKKNDRIQQLEEESKAQKNQYESTIEKMSKEIHELKQQLEQEKGLREKQISALEELNVAEFEDLEKEHTEFVSNLVNSYQREVDSLRKELSAAKAALAHKTPMFSDARPATVGGVPEGSSPNADIAQNPHPQVLRPTARTGPAEGFAPKYAVPQISLHSNSAQKGTSSEAAAAAPTTAVVDHYPPPLNGARPLTISGSAEDTALKARFARNSPPHGAPPTAVNERAEAAAALSALSTSPGPPAPPAIKREFSQVGGTYSNGIGPQEAKRIKIIGQPAPPSNPLPLPCNSDTSSNVITPKAPMPMIHPLGKDSVKFLEHWAATRPPGATPTESEKREIISSTGISPAQLENWFNHTKRSISPLNNRSTSPLGKCPISPTSSDSSASSSSRHPTKRSLLSPETIHYLKNWMMSPEHCENPYPTEEEKVKIMADTGIGMNQLNVWFVNNRKRFWLTEVKPRIAEIKKSAVYH